jgi:hypothetical protein
LPQGGKKKFLCALCVSVVSNLLLEKGKLPERAGRKATGPPSPEASVDKPIFG